MSDKKRNHILLYTDRPGIYGAEQCNHAIICGLADAGYQTSIVQPFADHHLVIERDQRGITQHWLQPDDIYDLSRPARTLTDEEEPLAILSSTRPDLIIFGDSSPLSNLKAKQVARQLQIPYIVLVHCVNPQWAVDYAPFLDELPAVYSAASAVVAVSQANLNLLHELFGLPPQMGQVIHYGRPSNFFDPPSAETRNRLRQELNISESAVVCITIARLDYSKGYQYQLDALVHLRKCPSWSQLHFLWVGSGFLEDRLRTYVKLIKSRYKVHFLGERVDVADLLDCADMFVLPSQFEGMPLSIMEAMAKGLPVAATAVSGTPEELGKTGHLLPDPLVSPAMPKELAEVICRWAGQPELRQKIGQLARQRAKAMFREEQMVNNYLALIEKRLKGDETFA